MKKIVKITVLCFFASILIACSNKKISSQEEVIKQELENEKFSISIGEDEKLLYSIMAHRLGVYDLKVMRWKPIDDTDNMFQYTFECNDKYFVTGHSIENGYRILHNTGKKLETMYTMNENEKIFPMVEHEGSYYYLVQKYKEAGEVDSKIVNFNNNQEMDIVIESDQKICDSKIYGNLLYYTAYNDKKDRYELYTIDLSKKKKVSKYMSRVAECREVYLHNKKVFLSDAKTIYHGEEKYKKRLYNYFLEDYNQLFQIDVNNDGNLEYYLTNLKTAAMNHYAFDIVNFEQKGSELILYGNGEIKKISLLSGGAN